MSLEVESVTAMDNLSKRIAQLPREKRELLLRRLQAENQQTVQKAQLPSITHMESDRWLPFPLSDIQKVYWVGQHDLFSLNTRATNVYLEYDIVNDDRSLIDRINHALLSLIERHDMLRAIILPDGTQYVPSTPLVFESSVVDLQHQSSLSINDSLEQARSALRIKRSTIGEWSCFDSMIHILPDKHIRWHLRIDSLVFDGTSRNVFMREIASLIRTPTISLPPMQCTYRDYVTFWNMLREHSLFQQSSSYWANLIPKLPHAPQLPLHPVEQHTQGHLTRNVFCVLDQKLWRQLKAKAKAHNLTPSIVVITAFTEILSAWSANVDYMIGLIGSDRPSIHEDIYNIIGNFNTVFLLTVQSPSESFIERAKALSHQLTEHMEHRYVSAFEVLRTCQRQHGWQSAPILPVMFNSLLEYNLPQFKRKDTREQFQKAVGSAEMIYSESAPPHLLLAPTVGEDAHERLVCNWRAVIQLFPVGLLQAM
ncbi:MAG TPA: condensation domain-containing protein, partial [Blastocatellia bacterium]|nr:condensation domain-containing protein [Blastocatellia bacterium]